MAVARLVGVTAACLGLALAGCSHRKPGACTVTCADDSRCPEGTSCAGDGFCHAADESGLCEALLDPPDGGPSTGDDGGADPDAADPVPDADPCDGLPDRASGFDSQDHFIPDDNLAGIDLTLSLDADCVTVETVEVYVEIIHEYRGDVEIRLTSPGGDRALLLASSNDSTQNIFATFDVPIAEGEVASGDWVLNVRDVVADLVGTVDYWSIGINRAAP